VNWVCFCPKAEVRGSFSFSRANGSDIVFSSGGHCVAQELQMIDLVTVLQSGLVTPSQNFVVFSQFSISRELSHVEATLPICWLAARLQVLALLRHGDRL